MGVTRYLLSWTLLITTAWTWPCAAAGDSMETPTFGSGLPYSRLYADADGVSHFDDGELPLSVENYSPPANPMAIHAFQDTQSATFVLLRKGVFEDWHPVPRRQYAVIVSGRVEVTASDGEKRQFGPGMMVLLEDTTGKGHRTRVVGDEDNLTLMIAVGSE